MIDRIKKINAINSSNETKILLSSAKIAASKAIRSSILGITYKVIIENEIIAIYRDNSRKILRKIPPPSIDISSLKKGMVLKRR